MIHTIESIKKLILKQYLRGQNCEKTNAIYRKLLKENKL
jgi:hypothetical protein